MSTLGARHCHHTGVVWARNGRGRPFRGRERPEWAGDSSTAAYDFWFKKKTLHWWRHILRPLRSVSSNLHSDVFSWKFIRFPIHITRGYICPPCMFWTYLYSFIRLYYKFTYLKTPRLPQGLEPASFALQPDALSITSSDPEELSDIFGYIQAFSLISTLN